MDKRIGAQLYTVRNSCQTEQDFEETIKKVHEMGYKVVQLSGINFDIPAEKIKEICDKYGMTIACTHKNMADFEENLDEVIAYHKAIGCKVAGLGWIPPEVRESFDTIKAFVEKYNVIAKKLAENGLTFAYHNHAFEFAKYGEQSAMDYMIENANFGFILDVYWVAHAGIDPAAYIKKLGKRVVILHYKDRAVDIENNAYYAEVGRGNLDWDSIIAASGDAEFALVEQDTCKDNEPFESLKISYDFLSKKGFE